MGSEAVMSSTWQTSELPADPRPEQAMPWARAQRTMSCTTRK